MDGAVSCEEVQAQREPRDVRHLPDGQDVLLLGTPALLQKGAVPDQGGKNAAPDQHALGLVGQLNPVSELR